MGDVSIGDRAIRIGPRLVVSFQRTLRIPDDGKLYPLPPGLGVFPIFKVQDYWERLPPVWREQGGAFIPMYQREALWLGFDASTWKPNAVQVAIGRINAVSGEPLDAQLNDHPQNYMVCPDQPWLDGIHCAHGSVRQFIAMPLGLGYTVEASVSGTEQYGGIQITAFEPKPGKFPETPPAIAPSGPAKATRSLTSHKGVQAMGLGAGGLMKQKIYPDPHGLDTWDQANFGRVVVHIVNSAQFLEVTGIEPPSTPVSAKTYTDHGLPWFDLYDEAKGDVAVSSRLAGVRSVSARDREQGSPLLDNSIEVPEEQIRKLHPEESRAKDPASPRSRQ